MVRSDTVSSRLEWCFLRASYFASRGVMKRAVPRDFPGCSVPVLSAGRAAVDLAHGVIRRVKTSHSWARSKPSGERKIS